MSERFVLLGVARSRTPWFAEVARWCSGGSFPASFTKCLSITEARARLATGTPFSALLIDGHLPGLDRDLVAFATAHDCPVIVVAEESFPLDDRSIGFASRLDPDFPRPALLDALTTVATPVDDVATRSTDPPDLPIPAPWHGQLVAVCGTGGTGASTAAVATAQALGQDPRHCGLVALADLALDADLAVLHGTDDVVPGLPELIDGHRRGQLTPEEVLRLTFDVPDRHYRLLLGLRRHSGWTMLRPNVVQAALISLRRAFRVVVADVDADVEGDQQCGVIEVEDRNLLAREALAQADVVVLVVAPGLKGIHALARTVNNLVEFGVDPTRVVPVVNRAPKRITTRAELVRTAAEVTPTLACPPIFLPDRSSVDDLHRDVSPLPAALCGPLAGAIRLGLARPPMADRGDARPERVATGVGAWTAPDAATS